MVCQRNQNELLRREYGCKWQTTRFQSKLASLGMGSKMGKTICEMKSHLCARSAGVVACLLLLLAVFLALLGAADFFMSLLPVLLLPDRSV